MPKKISHPNLLTWIEARKRYRHSDAHVQMTRELGLNPAKFGGYANHRQEPWKAPLPDFIEHLYEKRFRKSRPDRVMSIEQVAREREQKRAARREERRQRQQPETGDGAAEAPDAGERRAVASCDLNREDAAETAPRTAARPPLSKDACQLVLDLPAS